MPARKRAAERKRSERRPTTEQGWLYEPVGTTVQTEITWAERERPCSHGVIYDRCFTCEADQ